MPAFYYSCPLNSDSRMMVSIQEANPKGFLRTILAQIKLLWLKLCHPEAGTVKPLGFFDPAAE